MMLRQSCVFLYQRLRVQRFFVTGVLLVIAFFYDHLAYPILFSITLQLYSPPPPRFPSTSTFDTPDHLYIKLKGLGLGRPTTYTIGSTIDSNYTSYINQRVANHINVFVNICVFINLKTEGQNQVLLLEFYIFFFTFKNIYIFCYSLGTRSVYRFHSWGGDICAIQVETQILFT